LQDYCLSLSESVKGSNYVKKVLVEDNHPVLLKFISNILKMKGSHILTADGGLTALDRLQTFIPDVVFVDLVMPNID